MPTGMAVRASARLCRVSESSATDPDSTTTTAWNAAVTPSTASEIHSARMPSFDDSMTESTRSAASWLCGVTRCLTPCQSFRGAGSCPWPCPCSWCTVVLIPSRIGAHVRTRQHWCYGRHRPLGGAASRRARRRGRRVVPDARRSHPGCGCSGCCAAPSTTSATWPRRSARPVPRCRNTWPSCGSPGWWPPAATAAAPSTAPAGGTCGACWPSRWRPRATSFRVYRTTTDHPRLRAPTRPTRRRRRGRRSASARWSTRRWTPAPGPCWSTSAPERLRALACTSGVRRRGRARTARWTDGGDRRHV